MVLHLAYTLCVTDTLYIVSPTEEGIYISKRHNTIKVAIQEGLQIIPTYSFGNTNLFNIIGSQTSVPIPVPATAGDANSSTVDDKSTASGAKVVTENNNSPKSTSPKSKFVRFIEWLSRKLRMSILFFYGRGYLTIPYSTPIRCVRGKCIPITQNDNPTDAEIQHVLDQVIAELRRLYDESKPEWEKRPLVIY